MENSLKTLTLAAGIFMTCVIISMSFLLLREGKHLGNLFLKELREESRLYGENKWTRYEGAVISGAEVINAIRRYQKDLDISVDNLFSQTIYSKENIFLLSNNNSLSISYIEPFDDYIGSLIRRKNGEVWKISFMKKG